MPKFKTRSNMRIQFGGGKHLTKNVKPKQKKYIGGGDTYKMKKN